MVSIACGGTGGHLFPGLAVADPLVRSGCAVQLLISPKDVDREGVKSAEGMEIIALPAVGLQPGAFLSFLRGAWRSYRIARATFRRRRPAALLAMGGFTSLAPVVACRQIGVPVFLHESNSIPGRANRLLSFCAEQVFVGFPSTARRFGHRRVIVTGTPVRMRIQPMNEGPCRSSLGFEPDRPLLLITGGSQGARAINDIVISALPLLAARLPELQYIHLTGPHDFDKVNAAYVARRLKAVVRPFLSEMDLALAAATAAISRAGASSLAEFAAARVPAILIPYPAAADNHQFFNATAFVESGAARMIEQGRATPELLVAIAQELIIDSSRRNSMRSALTQWHRPDAGNQIVTQILSTIEQNGRPAARTNGSKVDARLSRGSDRAEARSIATV